MVGYSPTRGGWRYWSQVKRWRARRVAEQAGLCFYCKKPMPQPTLDHVVPLSRGGSHSYDNTVAACEPCNVVKGNSLKETQDVRLRKTP